MGYETAALKIKVGTTIESTSTGYVISLSKSNASPVKWYGPTYCGAYLLQTGKPTHWGTDKVDDIMVVREPQFNISNDQGSKWETGWPDPVYLAYSDENGLDVTDVYNDGSVFGDTKGISHSGEGLKTREIHVVLCDNPTNGLPALDGAETPKGWKMKALGSLYSTQSMKDHFESYPNDRRVLIWQTFDEPITGCTKLDDIYQEYWDRCANTDRPIMINLSLAYPMEDCIRAMDILCSDPYTDVPGMERHRNVIKDYIKASKAVRQRDGTAATKRLAIIIWGYYHPHIQDPSGAQGGQQPPQSDYTIDHGFVKGDSAIDILGLFTYCCGSCGYTRLPNQTNGWTLWTKIKDLNTPR